MLGRYSKSFLTCLDLLKIIHSKKTVAIEIIYELQFLVLNKIQNIEKNIVNIKKEISVLKKSFPNSRQEKITLSKKIIYLKEKIKSLHYIIQIYKSFIDGVAYTFFDKYDLKVLGGKEEAGFIHNKVGLKKELEILKGLQKTKKIAILNDISNCLRFGDITVYKDGFPYCFEIKTKEHRNKKVFKQIQAIKDTYEYLVMDKLKIKDSNIIKKRVSIPSPEINHVDKFNILLEKAKIKGNIYEKIEEGLYYSVNYSSDLQSLDKIIHQLKGKAIVLFTNTYKRNSFGFTPFCLTIKNKNNFIDFYKGLFVITVIIDSEILQAKLAKELIEVEFKDDDYFPLLLKNKGQGELKEIQVSYHPLSRIGAEFISLQWFVELLVHEIRKNYDS